ncbi:MAG: gas vesicle protein [Terriglobia bacterium]|jgi:hypothetical protein
MPVEDNLGNLRPRVSELALDDAARVSLCEVLDRVLNKGVVVAGEATISVAGVDLIYLGLQIVLTSMETARQSLGRAPGEPRAGMGDGKEKANGFPGTAAGGV